MRKPLPIVLFRDRYWKEVINFDALVLTAPSVRVMWG